jgi:alcohol dehydrogenase class IV
VASPSSSAAGRRAPPDRKAAQSGGDAAGAAVLAGEDCRKKNVTDIRLFSAPTHVIAGLGALDALPGEIRRLDVRRLAVVLDPGVAEAGVAASALELLAEWDVWLHDSVAPEPAAQDAEAAASSALSSGCEAVVAIGGGSALVVGKVVALRLRNAEHILAYAGRDRANPPAPCIGIPTTAGSGSEVSNALVVTDPDQPSVVVVRGRGYEPQVAILDAALLQSLPRTPMLVAALDALCHALEALWARQASLFTDALAFYAAERIFDVLPRALERREPGDVQVLLEASAIANLACGSAGLGLVHALSLASAVHIPHGRQNGVLLPHVAAFTREAARPEVRALIDRIASLYEHIGFEPAFVPGELDASQVKSMVEVALAAPLNVNNARQAGERDLFRILEQAGSPVPLRV